MRDPIDSPPGRLRLTWYAAVQAASFVPLIVLFVFWVVGGVLMVVWVGALFLAAAIPATRWLANAHRRMAADVLGTPLPAPYVPLAGLPPSEEAPHRGDRPDDLARPRLDADGDDHRVRDLPGRVTSVL